MSEATTQQSSENQKQKNLIQKETEEKIEKKCFFLPDYHKENYLKELEILENQIKNLIFESQYEIANEKKIRAKLIQIKQFYHLDKQFAETLLTHYINLIFSNPALLNHKNEQIFTLYIILQEMKKHQKTDLTLDWKKIYDFLFEGPLGNNLLDKFGFRFSSKYLTSVLILLKKYYSQESCREVFDLYKSILGQNTQKVQQQILVNCFFKWSVQIPSKVYKAIFQELHDLQYLANKKDRTIYFQGFDVTEYIDEILEAAINEIQSFIPTKISAQKKINHKLVQIIQLLIKLLQPRNKIQYEKIWKNIERIFTILKQYIHHKNFSASWSNSVLSIIQLISKEFIKKVMKDQHYQKILEQIKAKRQEVQKNQKNISEQLEEDEEDEENDSEQQQENDLQQGEHDLEGSAQIQEQFLGIENQDDKEQEEYSDNFQNQLILLVQESLKSDQIDESIFQQFEKEMEGNLLTQEHIDSFFELIAPVLQQIVYLSSDHADEIIKQALVIESKKTIEIILPRIYSQLENIETKGNKPIKILKLLVPYLLDRKIYKQGLYEILNIFKYTGDLLTASNFSLAKTIWGLYSYIFSMFPVWDPEDLQKDFLEKNPEKTESDFREILNQDEELDMYEFYQQYSEFTLSAYQKILQTFNFVENQKGEPSNTESFCYQSPHNIFFTYAFNCSPSIIKISIVSLVQSLSKIQINAQKYFSYAINAFTLREPQQMLKALLEKIINEVLVKRREINENYTTPTKFQFENQREILQNYQIEHINKDSLKWYLDILDDLLTFSGSHIEQYDELIYKLVVICLQYEEEVIFKMGIRIVHKILISNLSDYIKDFKAYPKEVEEDNFGFVNFHKNLGLNNKFREKLNLNEISQKQRDYALKVYKRIVEPVFDRFQNEILKEELNENKIELQPYDNFSEIVDKFYSTQEQKQKRGIIEEFKRGFKILKIMYCSISPRTYEIQENKFQSLYSNFEEYYLYSEYKNEQIRYIEFLEQFCDFLINSSYLSNLYVVQGFVSFWKEIFEEQKIQKRIALTKKWEHSYKHQNSTKNPKKRTLSRRFYLFSRMNMYQERLQEYKAYVFNCDRLDKLNLYSFLFCFYPLGRHTSQIYVLYNQMNSEGSLNLTKYIHKVYEFLEKKLDISSPEFIPALLQKDKSLQQKLQYIMMRVMNFRRNLQDIKPNLYEIYLKNFQLTLQYDHINDQLSQQLFSQWYLFVVEMINYTTSKFWLLKIEKQQKTREFSVTINTSESYKQFDNQYQQKQKQIQQEHQEQQLFKKQEEFLQQLEQIFANEIEKQSSSQKKKKSLNMLKQSFRLNEFSPKMHQKYLQQIQENLLNDDIKIRKMSECELLVDLRKLKYKNIKKDYVSIEDDKDYKNRDLLEFTKIQYTRDFSPVLQENQSITQNNRSDAIQTSQMGRKYLRKTLDVEKLQEGIKQHQILNEFKQNSEFLEKTLQIVKDDLHFLLQNNASLDLNPIFPLKSSFVTKFLLTYMKNNQPQNQTNYQIRLLKYLTQYLGYPFFQALKKFLNEALENLSDQKNTYFCISVLRALFQALIIRHKFADFSIEQLKEAKQYIYETLATVYYCNDKNVTSKLFSYFLNPVFTHYKIDQFQDLFDYLLQSASKFQIPETNKEVKIQELYLDQMKRFSPNFLEKQQLLINQFKKPFIYDLKVIETQSHQLTNLIYNQTLFIYFKDFKAIQNSDFEEQIEKHKQNFYKINDNYLAQQNKEITNIIKGYIDKALEQDEKNYYYAQLILDSIKQLGHIPAKGFNGKILSNSFQNLKLVLEYLLKADEKLYPTKQDIRQLMRSLLMQYCFTRFDNEYLLEVLNMVKDNLGHENWKNRQKTLIFYQGIIYFNLYTIQSLKIDIFEPIFPLLVDQDKNVQQTAQSIYSDFFKLIDIKELKKRALDLKKLAADKKQEIKDREKALYGLMSVLLAHPYEIYDFTEGVLEVILKNKNLGQYTKEFLKQFLSKFFKSYNKEDYEDDSHIKLSSDMEQRLREIAIPYNYFA
ncbi:Armadillo-type fold [Pseudocohnilembus persalinus]|uniref:Armadillo-type fold n=1 Tax=Pseudocohnilembus persalinus TaxID=266149 RepID=A0A0V0R117_PSEPJ|nr:Armadillo-type fold [Pseudocohnilembus persalinus]|eukprot:KRX08188.1 Armadillo-type fold [Pseudocohnilembus persalinus]